jgi:hypothetical protein
MGWDRGPNGGPLPRLDGARAGYPGSDLSFAVWMTTPSVDLDDLTPAQALQCGRHEEVTKPLAAMRAIG